jgi:hypothetical protein
MSKFDVQKVYYENIQPDASTLVSLCVFVIRSQ